MIRSIWPRTQHRAVANTRYVRTVAGAICRPAQLALYLLSGLVPRDSGLWAFGTWGDRYADNAAAVFERLQEEAPAGVRAAWISASPAVVRRLRERGARAHLRWTPSGMWAAIRAGVHVYDSTPRDVSFWLSRGAHLVLLRHGIGMKKIERAIDTPSHRLYHLFHGGGVQRWLWRLALPWHLPVPALVSACSPEHADQAPAYFGVERGRVVITGFPRHDRLAERVVPEPAAIPVVGPPLSNDRPVVLYLPTLRESYRREWLDLGALRRAARDNNVTIAIKLHPIEHGSAPAELSQAGRESWVRLVEPNVDALDLYPHARALITDVSSTAFDFLLLKRPIVHFLPDRETLEAARPLHSPLEDLALGPICTDAETLSHCLQIADDPRWRRRRSEMSQRVYTHPPGGASDRVIRAIAALAASR